MMSEITRHYLISGRVQGVGYRAFTRQSAVTIGVTGWARNLKDGRVEVLACGTAEKLDQLEAKLNTGPTYGNVENVVVTNQPHGECGLAGFDIQKDGENPWPNNE